MKYITRRIKLLFLLAALNFKITLIYRASFAISFLLSSIWVLSFVAFVEIIFSNINMLGSLNKGEVLLVMAYYYLFNNITDLLYRDNFEDFGVTVRTGYLDIWLTKPVPARMATCFAKMRFDYLTSFCITGGLFAYAFHELPQRVNVVWLLAGVGICAIGIVVLYALLSIIATLTFWIEKNDTINTTAWHLTQVTRYPREIYTGITGIMFTYIAPLALIANLPAEFTVQKGPLTLLAIYIATTIVLYVASKLFWEYGMKKYISAA